MRQPGGRLFLDAGPIIPPGATAGRVPWMLQAGCCSLPSMPPAGRVPGCSRPRRGPLFYQATTTSTAAAPGSNEQHHQLGGFPGCSRPRRGPLFYQATPTSTAAAPGSNEGANMRQQGCSCFHLSRANSWARVPWQQHYKFCNKCRVNIAREATGPTAGTHEAAGPLFSSWMLAPILTNTRGPWASSWHPRGLDSWAGSLDARNCITFFVINIGAILARHPGPRPSSI